MLLVGGVVRFLWKGPRGNIVLEVELLGIDDITEEIPRRMNKFTMVRLPNPRGTECEFIYL